MKNIKERLLKISLPKGQSAFLWGPRKTGKSYWIGHNLRDAIVIDLLKTDVFAEYASRPALLRERYADTRRLIVIDEIQTVPELLNEVHWLIENCRLAFLLTGSSARKLRRKHANLLAGRAWRYTMMPLAYPEIGNWNLNSLMQSGLLPPHYLSSDPRQDLRAYVADYLKEEIASEAAVQSLPSFAEFLRVAACSTGELINYCNIARESGVSARTVRSYFQILEDTLLGYRLQPWVKKFKRRLIQTEKFYLFDTGLTHFLAGRVPTPGTPEFGHALEHYIMLELMAYRAYRNPELDIHFWRTSTGFEVDFILGPMETAVEVKGSARVGDHHLRGLRALREEHKQIKPVVVSLENIPRKTADGIRILPVRDFCEELWLGKLSS
jgi:predicted AAA+ superfamily ATPase